MFIDYSPPALQSCWNLDLQQNFSLGSYSWFLIFVPHHDFEQVCLNKFLLEARCEEMKWSHNGLFIRNSRK